MLLIVMVATIVPNTINENDISLEQQVRNDLQQEKSFGFLNSQQQEELVKQELQNRINTIDGSSDASKDILFQSRLDEELNTYIQFNSTTDKEWEKRFVHKHVQRIIDSGEELASLDPEDIIKQSVRLEVKDPEKRREELGPKTEDELITELTKQLDDSNSSLRVDKKLTKIVSLDKNEFTLRYSNLRTRLRVKRWVTILNAKSAEESVLWMLSTKSLSRWWKIAEYVDRWFSKLQDVLSINTQEDMTPTVLNEALNKKYISVFKPVLDQLKKGTWDDKELAKQLEEKLLAVKRSYGVKQLQPRLTFKNKWFTS